MEHEIPRQIEALSRGEKLRQSTRRWDDVAGVTEEMRTKEDAHDYRYFPDPDLMPLVPGETWLAEVRARAIELPLARKQRLMRDYQLPAGDAEVFRGDPALSRYFEALAPQAKNPKAVANWIINNLLAKLAELHHAEKAEQAGIGLDIEAMSLSGLADLKFPPSALLELVQLVEAKTISNSAAQQVFAEMFATGKTPERIVREKGLAQVSDAAVIEEFCDQVIAASPKIVADYQSGKTAALNSLKGQVMKLSKGKANPVLAGEILERKLKSP